MLDRNHPAEPELDLGVSGCLEFLWPALPHTLIDRAERRRIEEAVRRLPPTGGLGLELRLGRGPKDVDLHQVFGAAGADPAILGRYLARTAEGPLADPVARRFLSDWVRNDLTVQDAFHTLYVEWDRPTTDSPPPPAVFVPVEPSGALDATRRRRRDEAVRHCERITPGLGKAAGAAFDRICGQMPAASSVNYLGFMLGRGDALRVNVRGLRPGELRELLLALQWPGDMEAATRHFEQLVGLADRVIVGLDFAPDLQASIGFEAVLDLPPAREPRWLGLFDYIVAQGACAEEERRALETLPASFYPEAPGTPWPASWLVAAVLSPKAFAPWVERRLSHLKLVVAGDGAVSAKAYVSAQHHWRRSTERLAPSQALDQGSAEALAEAIERALAFITGAIGQDDLWRDFSMPGASDEWVTGFIGCALAPIADERARLAARRSLTAILLRQRPDGGWGYNRLCASDADSTAWAVKFLDAMQVAGPAVEKARVFLRSHVLPDGGLSTYNSAAQLRFDDKPWNGSGDGWRSSHLCVAANAAGALPGELDGLLTVGQASDGSWPAYWWRTDIFSTALAVQALSIDGDDEARSRAMAWARQQQTAAMSAFDRAWLAQILMRGDGDDVDAARAILVGLALEQGADGSWAAGAQLCLPHPSQQARDERSVPFLDVRRLYTTASVLAAMTAFRERLAQ